mgnify:CR=1 FL=1
MASYWDFDPGQHPVRRAPYVSCRAMDAPRGILMTSSNCAAHTLRYHNRLQRMWCPGSHTHARHDAQILFAARFDRIADIRFRKMLFRVPRSDVSIGDRVPSVANQILGYAFRSDARVLSCTAKAALVVVEMLGRIVSPERARVEVRLCNHGRA